MSSVEEGNLRQKFNVDLLKFVDKCENGNGHPIGVRGRVSMGNLYFVSLNLAGVFLVCAASEPKLRGRYVESIGWAFLLVLGGFVGWHVLKALGRLAWRLIEIAVEPMRKSRVSALAEENEALKKKLAEYAPITNGTYRGDEWVGAGEPRSFLVNGEVVEVSSSESEDAKKPALLRQGTKEWGT